MSDDESSDDPFDAFDATEDGDPFEDFEDPPDTDDDSTEDDNWDDDWDDDAGPGRMDHDPFDRDSDATAGPTDASDAPSDDPFADFSEAADDGDPFEAFESAGVEEIDSEAVWQSLSTAERGVDEDDDRVFSEVSKHRFCERCEHFSGPPEVRCTYEGAAIVEFLDMETVRLVDCPIVAQQRALEGEGSGLE